jgi:hypothetical protein
VVKGLQALLADVFLVGLQVGKDLGRVARNAQRRAGHQKGQDQQEPPGAVHRVELTAKQLGPERPELVDVVDGGSCCLSTVPMTDAMQITVSSEIANRMDDSSSTAARRACEPVLTAKSLGWKLTSCQKGWGRKRAGPSREGPPCLVGFIGG